MPAADVDRDGISDATSRGVNSILSRLRFVRGIARRMGKEEGSGMISLGCLASSIRSEIRAASSVRIMI